MKVCFCTLPSMFGSQICKNCSNNWEQDSTFFNDIPITFLPERQYNCIKCGNNNQDKIDIKHDEEQKLLFIECKKCGHCWKEDPSDKQGEHGTKELKKLLKEYEKE